jgi:hypothetical protein
VGGGGTWLIMLEEMNDERRDMYVQVVTLIEAKQLHNSSVHRLAMYLVPGY